MRSKGEYRRAVLAALISMLAAPPAPLSRGAEEAREDLSAAIKEAIKEGRERLLRTYPRSPSGERASYAMGRTALPLAALLRAGVSSDHPAIAESFKELAAMPPKEVYSVSCYLIALDALVQARAREAREAREAAYKAGTTLAVPARPAAEGAVLARMEEMVRWLLRVRNPGEGTWHYRDEGGHDYSNTQFAVLGLAIGLEHHIPIPREVFLEIARQFSSQSREKAEVQFTITYNPSPKAFLTGGGTVAVKKIRKPVGGWGYTRWDKMAYASMTAAGASSLLVAREGLGGKLGPGPQEALEGSLGWIATSFDRFLDRQHHFYYTLYSLEKVGDLGDIAAFNGRDWYLEGARQILERQSPNGGWGNPIDTSFALLFLTRATRPALKALPAPRVITNAGAGSGDLVHVGTIGGFISAREFLEYLAATRDTSLLKVAGEVASNYPLSRQGELVPWLLPLWAGPGDPIGAFARKALAEATGETYRTPEEYAGWHASYLAIRAAEEGRDKDPRRLSELLSGSPGRKLKGILVELISRSKLAACIPALIEELRAPDASYCRRALEVLERLAGEAPSGLSLDTPGDRGAAVQTWKAFWSDRGGSILARERIGKLIASLEEDSRGESGSKEGHPGAPGGEGDPERALESLVREGNAAVPPILEAMSRPEFPAKLLIALERISKKRLGLRPAPWKAWWEAEGKSRENKPAK